MTIILISAIIGAIVAGLWYSNKKRALYDEYQKQMEQYLNQIEQPQQQQTTEEHYTMFFKVNDEQYIRWFTESE